MPETRLGLYFCFSLLSPHFSNPGEPSRELRHMPASGKKSHDGRVSRCSVGGAFRSFTCIANRLNYPSADSFSCGWCAA